MVFDRVSWSDTPVFHNTLVVGSSPTSSTTQSPTTGEILLGGVNEVLRAEPTKRRRLATTPLSSKRLSHLGLGNSKFPRDCGGL